MALIKEKETKGGYIANYWIADCMIDAVSKKTIINVILFKDKDSRLAGKSSVNVMRISTVDGVYLSGEEIYAIIKQNSFFSDATDLI